MQLTVLALLAAGLAGSALAAPTVPRRAVPVDGPVDVEVLLRQSRIQQGLNARTYYDYSFRQTTRVEVLDERGERRREETRVYRVIPNRNGTIRHLLETDGEPPSERETRRQLKRNEKVRKRWEKIRQKRERELQRRREETSRDHGVPAPSRERPTRDRTPRATASDPPAKAAPSTRSVTPRPTGPDEAEPSARSRPGSPVPAGPPTGPPAGPGLAATRPPPTPPGAPGADSPDDALPPPPTCDPDDPVAQLRPPPAGSRTSARRDPGLPGDSSRRAREDAGDYSLFELLSLTDYEYEGACRMPEDDRLVHVLSFAPPDDFDPLNPVERVMSAMSGTILIDADELQVVRARGDLVAPVKWGAGLVALREASVLLEARKVNAEVWLPSASVFEFRTRVLLDKDWERVTHYFDDHKKKQVTMTEEFLGPASPGSDS